MIINGIYFLQIRYLYNSNFILHSIKDDDDSDGDDNDDDDDYDDNELFCVFVCRQKSVSNIFR